ncbi:MAG: hypothetical protein HYR75_04570 [Gemmatimonadetes bacterium]|nr:hypothetical protein [Gemmatimonadota bacterium]MBI3566768.1 hypothetical protein [Gemmatimonadota bacterium]
MPHARRLTLALGAMALLLNIGCYSFQRPATGAVPAGTIVRMKLTPEGTTALARYLGPRVGGVEGTIDSVRADGALVVAVETVEIVGGQWQPWTGEGEVTFPRDMVAGLEQRVLDRQRSWITAIIISAAAVAIASLAMHGAGAHTTGDASTGTPPAP